MFVFTMVVDVLHGGVGFGGDDGEAGVFSGLTVWLFGVVYLIDAGYVEIFVFWLVVGANCVWNWGIPGFDVPVFVNFVYGYECRVSDQSFAIPVGICIQELIAPSIDHAEPAFMVGGFVGFEDWVYPPLHFAE